MLQMTNQSKFFGLLIALLVSGTTHAADRAYMTCADGQLVKRVNKQIGQAEVFFKTTRGKSLNIGPILTLPSKEGRTLADFIKEGLPVCIGSFHILFEKWTWTQTVHGSVPTAYLGIHALDLRSRRQILISQLPYECLSADFTLRSDEASPSAERVGLRLVQPTPADWRCTK
jgi:hypothetical protein